MYGTAIITIGQKQWQVYVATTYEEIIQGLGGLSSIPPQTGMIFDLGYDHVLTVTTIPMFFPLDIVFISSGLRVADIARNVPPGALVASDDFARYFLEVNAGETAGVQIGDGVHVQILTYPAADTGQDPVSTIVNFGMTAMAMLFAGSIAKTVIEDALAPPEKEKELPLGYVRVGKRKLLPPGRLPPGYVRLAKTKPKLTRDDVMVVLKPKTEALEDEGNGWKIFKEIGAIWFQRGVEAGKTDGWMTVEDTVGETLEDHPKITDASDLVWTAIEEWQETDHYHILYGSKMMEHAGGDLDLYSELVAEFWEGYLTGRKEIGFDIYRIAAELIQQRERHPATGLTEEEAKRQASELTKSGAKGYMGRTEYMGIAKKIVSDVWIRLGDRGDYERFDGPFNAGKAVGERLAHRPEEHLILMYHYRSAGVEIEPYFVGRNYISLFWGDEDAQWIRDLSSVENREFERGVRYTLTPAHLPQTVDKRREAEDKGMQDDVKTRQEYPTTFIGHIKRFYDEMIEKEKEREEEVDKRRKAEDIGVDTNPRLIGQIRHPETPERLEFFADSRDHIEDSIEHNGLHPQLETIFMEAITRAKAGKVAERMMGD